jgi:formylglycine-generating enzyme required for sulfatase activity
VGLLLVFLIGRSFGGPLREATVTPALGIGSTQTREKDGMVMVYVPERPFTMGSENGEDDEKPVHTMTLSAYWIDQTEVTNGKYALCVQEGVCAPPLLQ